MITNSLDRIIYFRGKRIDLDQADIFEGWTFYKVLVNGKAFAENRARNLYYSKSCPCVSEMSFRKEIDDGIKNGFYIEIDLLEAPEYITNAIRSYE